jgi:hypothetical protein
MTNQNPPDNTPVAKRRSLWAIPKEVPMRPEDPICLTTGERRSEIAAIFGAGVLRLHARVAIPGDDPSLEISPESATACLEVPPETVLSVIHGS